MDDDVRPLRAPLEMRLVEDVPPNERQMGMVAEGGVLDRIPGAVVVDGELVGVDQPLADVGPDESTSPRQEYLLAASSTRRG